MCEIVVSITRPNHGRICSTKAQTLGAFWPHSQIESEVHLNNVLGSLTVSTFVRKAKGTAHVSRLSTQGSMIRLWIGNCYDSEMWTIAYPKQRCWPN